MGERFTRFQITFEGEKCGPHHVMQAAVGHHHVQDGLRLDLVPYADSLEQPPRRCDDGRRAPVGGGARQCRIRDRDGEGGPEPLAQRNREREAGEAAAADHHVDTFACAFAFHYVEVPGRPRVFTMITAGGRNAIRSDRLTRRMKRV